MHREYILNAYLRTQCTERRDAQFEDSTFLRKAGAIKVTRRSTQNPRISYAARELYSEPAMP